MFIFEYAKGWADLVVGELAASSESDRPDLWGYACVCIGRELEPFLEENYQEVNYVTGKYLQVFSMLPPPAHFLDQRIREMERADKSMYVSAALKRLSEIRASKYAYDDNIVESGERRGQIRHKKIEEKLFLLEELKEAGLEVSQRVDFLFFDFRRTEDDPDVDIDVIAAMQSPFDKKEGASNMMDLFERMATKAEKHYQQGDSVDEFVRSLRMNWSLHLAMSKATRIQEFIKSLLQIGRAHV